MTDVEKKCPIFRALFFVAGKIASHQPAVRLLKRAVNKDFRLVKIQVSIMVVETYAWFSYFCNVLIKKRLNLSYPFLSGVLFIIGLCVVDLPVL
jgi:hypothetical protein